MAKRNYLVEGVSGSGKSSVCSELQRRGYEVVDGDKELAYQGDPETGNPVEGFSHHNHIWNIDKLNQIIADKSEEVAFLCGGSRNFPKFIDKLDGVFVLDADNETIKKRILSRPGGYGKKQEELDLILRLNDTKEDIPKGTLIDARKPLVEVVDEILSLL